MTIAGIPDLAPFAIPLLLAHPFNDGSGIALTFHTPSDGGVTLITSWEITVNDATADDTLAAILIVDGTSTIWHEHASYVAADQGTSLFWRGCVVMASGAAVSLQGQLLGETTAVLAASMSAFLCPQFIEAS